MQLKKLELLAPAKNREIGIAAINCGADSLYIAGPAFGAREAAGNSISEVESLVGYARKFGVKIYLVLNTILYDTEIKQAVEIARQAYNCGCDALIIQDLGLLKAGMPPIPLFASTQTNIRTVSQAILLEKLGFQRLILARELSLKQIKEIRENTSVDLESFVHGALCVSYSGQCYISSRVTGRSGNRGECAQLCRSLYTLTDKQGVILQKESPVLSLKDLNLSDNIAELVSAGISSFKIEGRLKDKNYVSNIVRHYRTTIDNFIEKNGEYKKGSYGSIHGGFTPDPSATFNRGYTKLYIKGAREDWGSGQSAKPKGEFMGKITSLTVDNRGNTVIGHNSGKSISNGDGFHIISPEGMETGVRASVAGQGSIVTNGKFDLSLNSAIYRNYNHFFESQVEKNQPGRVIDVCLTFECKEGKTTLFAESECGLTASVIVETPLDLAKDAAKAAALIKSQLQKRSGDYSFKVTSYYADQQYFYRTSELNRSRRELADILQQKALCTDSRPKTTAELPLNSRLLKGVVADYRYNISNSLSKELYAQLGADVKGDAYEVSPFQEAELMRCKYCVRYQQNLCPRQKGSNLPAEPLYIHNNRRTFRLEFDCKQCEMVIFEQK